MTEMAYHGAAVKTGLKSDKNNNKFRANIILTPFYFSTCTRMDSRQSR